MPEMSTVASFITAVRDRRTSVSRAIGRLWDDRDSADDAREIAQELDTISFDPVDDRIRAALINRGLNHAQVNHLNSWPPAEKEEVRRALVAARGSSQVQTVDFFWELYDGAASHTHVDSRPASNEVHIVFQSPQRNVRKSGPAYGSIKVDI